MLIEKQYDISEEQGEELRRLCGQLSTSVPTNDQLQKILDSDACHLLLAKEDDMLLGMLTLRVDSDARGKGVGRALVSSALELAHQLDVKTVDLTSRPGREAANKLYQTAGFALRETNVYRYQFN